MVTPTILVSSILIALVYASCLLQGMTSSLFGASLIDLSEVFESSLAEVAALASTQAAASVAGALICGHLYSSFNVQHLLMLGGIMKGITMTLLPLSGSLFRAHVLSAFYGLTVPFNEAGSYILLAALQEGVRPSISTLVQGYHLMFAIGSGIAPLIVRPFVSNTRRVLEGSNAVQDFSDTSMELGGEGEANSTILAIALSLAGQPVHEELTTTEAVTVTTTAVASFAEATTRTTTNETTPPTHELTRIVIPYAIIGGLAFLVGVCFCIVRYDDSVKGEKSPVDKRPGRTTGKNAVDSDGDVERQTSKRRHRRSWLLTALTSLHALLYVHTFVSVVDFITVFAVLKGVSKPDSLFYLSGFFSTFSGFRLVPVLLSAKLSPGVLLVLVDLALIVSTATMYLWGSQSPAHLWYCTLALGATLAPIYGSGNAWLLNKERLSRVQTGALFTASAFGAILPSLLVGRWIEMHPAVFPLVPFLSSILLCGSMVSMLFGDRLCDSFHDADVSPEETVTQISKLSLSSDFQLVTCKTPDKQERSCVSSVGTNHQTSSNTPQAKQ